MNRALRRVHAARSRLDHTFDRVRAIPFENGELRSDCARYLCVLVSGFLETAVVDLVASYVADVAHPRAARLVERKLARTTNLNAERLAQLVGALDIDWEDDVRSYMGDVRKAAIDSVVALRHEIAHGQPTGVTLVAVTSYYHAIKEVVEYIADLADPAG
jgi:hypothetical protein